MKREFLKQYIFVVLIIVIGILSGILLYPIIEKL
tara:strand:+ start:570 stop:671 length:102 start_codon:yes stop_codon:yes gene_type:complete